MRFTDEIYGQYANMIYRYLYSFTRNEALAEELTQETFFQAVRTIGRYDGSAKLSTWLCAIAKNVYRTWQRKNPPLVEYEEEALEDAHAVPSAETEAIHAMEEMAWRKRLHNLKEPYKEVMYLRVYGALSFREIGAVMGKTENWARIMFYRGKEKLREDVEDDRSNTM